MTQEEKAKAYDEAIKIAKEELKGADAIEYNLPDSAHAIRTTVYSLFPELKESEDERMIQYFKDLAPFDKADELYEKYGFSHKDALAWLETQGVHANFRNGIQIGDKVTRNEFSQTFNIKLL